MADGVQFSPVTATIVGSTAVLTSKRKYEDMPTTPPPPPPTRRPIRFSSAPIITSSPASAKVLPPSYASVPSPMDDILITKQRSQETDNDQRLPFSNIHAESSGYQGTSKKIEIPNNRVGVIIGKSGETVKYLQLHSGAKIHITRDMNADPNSKSRLVELIGTQEQINKAEQLINDVLAEAEAGASPLVNKRINAQAGSESFVMKIPNNRVGLVFGKDGETIKSMQATTGARELRIPALKGLYYVLSSLSFSKSVTSSSKFQTPFNYLDLEICQSGSKTSLPHLYNNLDVIFGDFSQRIKQLLTDMSNGLDQQQNCLKYDLWAITDEFNLLVRCCLSILNFNEFDQCFVVEKCQIFVDVMCMLCVMDVASADMNNLCFSNLVSQSVSGMHGVSHVPFLEHYISFFFISEHIDMFLPFRLSMIEVFLDELLVHRTSLHVFFILINYASSNNLTSLFSSIQGDNAIIFELISAHFLIFMANDLDLSLFINRPLSPSHDKRIKNSEIGLNTALCILQNPVILSASRYLHSHLISIVSESMDVADCTEHATTFFRPSQSLISAFERSIVLYEMFIFSVEMEYYITRRKSSTPPENTPGDNFELYLCHMTRKSLEDVIFKLNGKWNVYLDCALTTPRIDVLDSAVEFLKENMFLLNKNSRVDIFLVLEALVKRAFLEGSSHSLLQNVSERNPHEIYFFSCLLKLMGISFSNVIIACTHFSGNMRCLRNCNECASCIVYEQLIDVIGTFQQLEIMIMLQYLPYDLHSISEKHEKCTAMFLHMYLLLSICFGSGFDFLVKGCIFVVMMLINMFTLDEDLFSILRPLLDSESIYITRGSLSSDMEKGDNLKSCIIIADNFRKAHKQISRGKAEGGDEEESEERKKVFLKSIIKEPIDETELDDLASFLDCGKSWKDYSVWFKNRTRFHKNRRHSRKKKTRRL